MILMIDNYDSFTYNLVQYFGELKARVEVYRNDEISIEEIRQRKPERIVISPGPSSPVNAGISVEVVRQFAGLVPVLGVCLGHQAIGHAFGGRIINARRLMHGKTSLIKHTGVDLFRGLKNPFEATRYHSLVIEKETCPECLEVIAWSDDEDAEIMGVRHRSLPVWGVQFHPESILTIDGKRLLENFLALK
ncbi:MAG TPA: aminodeoxychorismate/anthranilate synthase component II [Candidatus Omnitrophota bacterium]|jgi:anthranilate synthase component 2|nr:aminodeoxychorismate/anthranilate synthase component II [Candidatus Omnitrophota bacterium]